MKKVIYITNKEVPYRVKFFNELAKKTDLIVIFESEKSRNRNRKWAKSHENNFKHYYIDSTFFGRVFPICKMLKIICNKYDKIIFGCITSKKQLFLMLLMRMFNKKYILNLDGEIFIRGNSLKDKLKKFFIAGADQYLVAGKESAKELEKIINKKVIPYYFSSLTDKDIEKNKKIAQNSNREKYILVVGQYFDYKGLDIAVQVAQKLPKFNFKFIGTGYRTEQFTQLVKRLQVNNIEIVPFLQEKELYEEYRKCKMLLLPSRKECWGLVINEAASFGTPIVSTYGSGAAVEFLINSEYSEFLSKPNDVDDLYNKIVKLDVYDKKEEYSKYLLEKSKKYTIEHSVKIHLDVINEQ